MLFYSELLVNWSLIGMIVLFLDKMHSWYIIQHFPILSTFPMFVVIFEMGIIAGPFGRIHCIAYLSYMASFDSISCYLDWSMIPYPFDFLFSVQRETNMIMIEKCFPQIVKTGL